MGASNPAEASLQVSLEALVPGVWAHGIVADPVEIIATRWFGSDCLVATYRDAGGQTGQAMIRRADEARLRLDRAGRTRPMDADPDEWRLGAEAWRTRYAGLFDSMVAVSTSNLQPLPHQIKAVYEEMLPRVPLRFLLADDPGAGKTIMCGLYVKELMLRGDLARCLIVAPGSLVEQWEDELIEKFGLHFDILSRELINATGSISAVFEHHPLLIARMDQLARSDDLKAGLETSDWDLVAVDEAHRMSAHYFGSKLYKTLRYDLGQLLSRCTRHFLLMTATPHSGHQDAFELFLALLDSDRFEGQSRNGNHTTRPDDLMRRMVKEDLLTMDGKPLFPERHATTVPYSLSEAEAELYTAVTQYVRDEMGRADRLDEKDRRRANVGLALAVLQRRLASSPEAILRSLQRRRDRLSRQAQDDTGTVQTDLSLAAHLAHVVGRDSTTIDDAMDDLTNGEHEDLEEQLVDHATAAQTRTELMTEISTLDRLVEIAERVRASGTDRKWSELSHILSDHTLTTDDDGHARKLIVFTEHRDTLGYLRDRIAQLLGTTDAVVTIHGGMSREDRRNAQVMFTSDSQVRILVATDAAGEGVNLQRAHLMVNYDLPWNPNRIEQRFGRIHRIGQTEVCQLWNLVAENTREGDVYLHLLTKIDQQRAAYGGKVFDVLGDAFQSQSLRDLMMEAIRYGDRADVRARLDTVIDATAGDGIDRLLAERALDRQPILQSDVAAIRRQVEEAQARRLQPFYLQSFFAAAFERLGGQMRRREPGRFEITRVPASVRGVRIQTDSSATVLTQYERVCFDRKSTRPINGVGAVLLAPGHPLLEAVVELTMKQCAPALQEGAVFVDSHDFTDSPRLLVSLKEEIQDGSKRAVDKRFAFIELDAAGLTRVGSPSPYLDYRRSTDWEESLVAGVFDEPWLQGGAEETALEWAIENELPFYADEVTTRIKTTVNRVRQEVISRLTSEINRWHTEHARLVDWEIAGRDLPMRPETAERRERDLEARLARRLAELDRDESLAVLPPVIAGAALVVPQGLLNKLAGESAANTAELAFVARLQSAAEAVLAVERRLGSTPELMPHDNPGYDIRSVRPDGSVIRVKVQANRDDTDTISLTKNQIIMAKNMADNYRLALVRFGPDDHPTEVRYLMHPFDESDTDDFFAGSFAMSWADAWAKGGSPK